jgi:hypothetical protein
VCPKYSPTIKNGDNVKLSARISQLEVTVLVVPFRESNFII